VARYPPLRRPSRLCASLRPLTRRWRGLDCRLRCGFFPVMRKMSSSHLGRERRLSARRPAPRLLLQDHGIEHLLNDLLGLGVELGDGLELELEGIVGASFVLVKK